MRTGEFLLAALLVSSSGAALAQKKGTVEERQGTDPKPDTDVATEAYKKGNYERAIQQAKLALSRDEKYVPAMMLLAKSYFAQHKYELSQAIIKEAQGVDKGNAESHNLSGFIALQKDDRIAATASFKKATELDANYAAAWNNLAAQYLFAKNYDGAVESAEKSTQLAPRFAKGWLNLGSAYRGKQRYEESDKAYKKALELDPNYADAYFNLGILYLDATQMPNQDLVAQWNASINFISRYKQMMGARLGKDDPSDQYMADARKSIEKEQKKQDRERKKREKEAAKAAQPAAPAPAPAGKTGDK